MTKAKPPVDDTKPADDVDKKPEGGDQPEAEVTESNDDSGRSQTKAMLASAVTRLGWHERFQESAADIAEKLLTAVEAVQAGPEPEPDPASREYTTVN